MDFFHQYHTEPQILHNQKISFAPHIHHEVEIIVLFRGSARMIADGVEYAVREGDFLLIFPNTVHSYASESGVDVGKFIFHPSLIPDFGDVFESKRLKSPIIRADKIQNTAITALAREILDCYDASSAAVKKAYLFLLTGKLLELCEFEQRCDSDNRIVIGILNYCRKNFRAELTLASLADALYVSKSYVSHIFAKTLKISFCDYINALRIGEAVTLLGAGDSSVTEVAAQSGFGSIRTFNRAFLRLKGVTPKEYRKKLRAQSDLRREAGKT